MPANDGTVGLLEANASTLFLVGGALFTVFIANAVLTTYEGSSYWFASTFAWAAWVLVPLGLLGLMPALTDRRPYLARIGAVAAVSCVLSSALVFVGELLEVAGLLSEAPGVLGLAPFVAFITFSVAMALFGIAALVADGVPGAAGVLMLVTASMLPLGLTILGSAPTFVTSGVEWLSILAIGALLRSSGAARSEIDRSAEPA